jgi:hypothetical protein
MPTTSLFEKLRGEVDLAQLAGRYTELGASRLAYVGRCPHAVHEDQSPSFHVYPDRRFYCYGCRWHKDVVDLWAIVKGLIPGIEATLDLARKYVVSAQLGLLPNGKPIATNFGPRIPSCRHSMLGRLSVAISRGRTRSYRTRTGGRCKSTQRSGVCPRGITLEDAAKMTTITQNPSWSGSHEQMIRRFEQ